MRARTEATADSVAASRGERSAHTRLRAPCTQSVKGSSFTRTSSLHAG